MRRALKALFPAVAAGVFALGLAVPALAEEGQTDDHADEATDDHADESAGEHADETEEAEPTGFGSGEWDGLILAAASGVVLGAVGFASSRPGEIGGPGDTHH